MSDIWIKTSTTGATRWKKATAIHIKRLSATWSAAKNIWIKTGTSAWLRVWPLSGVYSTSDPFITTTASGSTPIYFDGAPIRIGTAYYGRNGTWDPNGFTISSYSYAWPYYTSGTVGEADQIGTIATGTFTSPSNALTISSQANASAADGKYISFRITANASNSAYNGTADSEKTYGRSKVIRRTPINISFGITGTADVGSTLSVGSSWNTTEAYKPDAARTTIYWYKSSSNTAIYEGQGRTPITSANGSYSYIVQPADLGSYIIAEETTFNTGSDYDIGQGLFTNGLNQVTAVTAIVADTTPQAFSTVSFVKNHPSSGSGGVVRTTSLSWNASTNATRYQIEYEGSNDNVNWTNVQTFASSSYTTSTSQSSSWGSPQPVGGYGYYYFMRARVRASNTSSSTTVIGDGGSYIYASGVAPGQPTFGTITKTGTTASIPVTVGTDGSNYLYSNPIEYQYRTSSGSYPGTWTSSSTTISLTGLSGGTTYYIKIRTRNYDELVSPENETSFTTSSVLTSPTISSVTAGNASGQPVVVNFSGGSGPSYQIYWTTGVAPTAPVTPDASGSSSPLTDSTGPTTASSASVIWYAYVRSVATVGETSVGPSSVASSWSAGYQFTVTVVPITPTIATPTYSNITQTTGTINWTSTNQSSYALDGSFTDTGTTGTSVAQTGLTAGTTYSGNVTVTSSTSNTASKAYSFTTSSIPTPSTPTVTNGTPTTSSWSISITFGSNTGSVKVEYGTSTSYGSTSSAITSNGTYTPVGPFASNTTYYWRVTPYSATNGTGTAGSAATGSITTATAFTNPSWTGTMPTWAATGANGSNFRRLATSLQYGWDNGTFSWSGSVGTSQGWDFYASTTQPASTSTARTPTTSLAYATSGTGTLIYTTQFIYRYNPTYNANAVYGSIRPYSYGTDGNKYVRSNWSGSI